MGEMIFVAAIQTVSLNKVFEIFKPENIREIVAHTIINEERTTDKDDLLGLKIIKETSNIGELNYSKDAAPTLTEMDIKKILGTLKLSGINDMIIQKLELEIELDPKNFNQEGEITPFIATFRNEICPNSPTIRDDLKEKNEKLYLSGDKQFRYRQLILSQLFKRSDLGTVHRRKIPYLIQLQQNWKRNFVPNFGDFFGSSKTVDEVQKVIGTYCIKENFILSSKREWEFKGFN